MKDIRGYLEPREVKKIMDHTKNPRDMLLIRLLWITGCRISELLNLKVKDVVKKDNILIMDTLKRRRPVKRAVLIDDRTMGMLSDFIGKYNIRSRVFNITRQRAWQIVREAGKRAGVTKVGNKKLHPHHFRHSHCVAWVRNNNTMEGLRKLQDRLKHASITTTAHYLQFATKESKKEVEKVFGEW